MTPRHGVETIRIATTEEPVTQPAARTPGILGRPDHVLAKEDIAAAVSALLGPSSPLADGEGVERALIVAVYLFGSYGRGNPQTNSDVDLGLLYGAAPDSTLLAQPFLVESALADHLGRQVQCVIMNTAPVDLVHRILRDGVLLIDSDPSDRIRFEVDARNGYFDLKPILDRYRRTLHEA